MLPWSSSKAISNGPPIQTCGVLFYPWAQKTDSNGCPIQTVSAFRVRPDANWPHFCAGFAERRTRKMLCAPLFLMRGLAVHQPLASFLLPSSSTSRSPAGRWCSRTNRGHRSVRLSPQTYRGRFVSGSQPHMDQIGHFPCPIWGSPLEMGFYTKKWRDMRYSIPTTVLLRV